MAVGSKFMRTRAMHTISSAKAPPREWPPAAIQQSLTGTLREVLMRPANNGSGVASTRTWAMYTLSSAKAAPREWPPAAYLTR